MKEKKKQDQLILDLMENSAEGMDLVLLQFENGLKEAIVPPLALKALTDQVSNPNRKFSPKFKLICL